MTIISNYKWTMNIFHSINLLWSKVIIIDLNYLSYYSLKMYLISNYHVLLHLHKSPFIFLFLNYVELLPSFSFYLNDKDWLNLIESKLRILLDNDCLDLNCERGICTLLYRTLLLNKLYLLLLFINLFSVITIHYMCFHSLVFLHNGVRL